jgi:hypothetical protein
MESPVDGDEKTMILKLDTPNSFFVMNQNPRRLSLLALLFTMGSAVIAAEPVPSSGIAIAPEGSLLIEHAPAPLYRDPVFDGAADPSVVYEKTDGSWLIYYTQRRANVLGPGVHWCFGTKIAIARSTDKGRTWLYVGTAKGLDRKPDIDTYWAPHVFKDGDTYHMFVTYIEGISHQWGGGAAPIILHYTSKNGLDWNLSDEVATGSKKIIDPAITRLPDQRWLLVFRDDDIGTRTALCVSDDLRNWKRLPQSIGDRRHEAPVILPWKNRYWMLTDDWDGLGVFVSQDGLDYTKQGKILDQPGRRQDDGHLGRHGGVAIVGDRAYIFYFVNPDRKSSEPEFDAPNTHSFSYKRSSLQIAELEIIDGKLTCDRDKHLRKK